jgi:hypothetical protein
MDGWVGVWMDGYQSTFSGDSHFDGCGMLLDETQNTSFIWKETYYTYKAVL